MMLLHDEYVNMLKVGIVDPTKVTRSALRNAASVASTFLTTEALLLIFHKKKLQCQVHREWVEWMECTN